jgi:hypothetical protein
VFFQFSELVPFQVPISVVYSIPHRLEMVFAMDRSLQAISLGSALVDDTGHVIGVMSGSASAPKFIYAVQVNAFLQRTLERALN